MDVLDQLGALREGKLSRRAFTKSLLAAGVGLTTMPVASRMARAAAADHGTYFTWSGFDVPELFGEYQAKRGEMPNFSIFGGSEEALTKMRAGFVVDVAHACNADVPRWYETGLFAPVDTSRLSNFPDLLPELYDMGYNNIDGKPLMIPFEWGQTSITYRTDLFELDGDESWDMLWDERYKGRLGSLASGGDAWWCGAIKAGVPFDQIGSDEGFKKTAEAMRAQRPLIRVYTDDTTTLEQALASGEMVAALTWSSSALTLQGEGVPVRFAQPKEGALTWVCGVMLHKEAPNIDSAYDIIDSLISKEAGEFLMGDYGYGHSNIKAFDKFTDQELADLNLSKKPTEILESGHFMVPQSNEWEAKMNGEFEQIKAGF